MQWSFLLVPFNTHFPIMTTAYAPSIAEPSCPGQPHSGDIL